MASLATALGLRAAPGTNSPPSYGAHYIILHFIFAYTTLSSRLPKLYHGLDHQASPRQDLTKYGPDAVKSGKITPSQLRQLVRIENCHANSVEHFPLFVGAILWAHVAGLRSEVVNGAGLAYTLARVGYAATYIFVESPTLSGLRGVFWWASNVVCLRLFWIGGKAINGRS